MKQTAREAEKASRASGKAFEDMSAVGSGFVDLGRRGVKPFTILVGALVALTPALVAIASSAAYAATSFVALAPAALGAATAFGAVGIAFCGVAKSLGLIDQITKGSAAAIKELQDRLARMSPAARTLFGQLVYLRQGFEVFRRSVEQATLPGFTYLLSALEDKGTTGTSVIAMLSKSILDMGRTISKTAAQAGAFFDTPLFKGALKTILANNQKAFESLSRAALIMLEPLTRIFAAASPLVARFGAYIESLANRFATFIDKFSDQKLIAFFKGAGDELAKWWKIATTLGDALFKIFSAALPSGQTLTDRLLMFTESIRDWAASDAGQKKLQQIFEFFAHLNYARIAKGIAEIAAAFTVFKVGTGLIATAGGAVEGIGKLATTGALGKTAKAAVTKPAAEAATGVAGGLATEALGAFVAPKAGGAVAGAVEKKAAAGGIAGMVGKLGGGEALGAIVGIGAKLTGIIGLFATLYATVKPFRDLINEVGLAFVEIGKILYDALKPAFDAVIDAVGAAVEAVKPLVEGLLVVIKVVALLIAAHLKALTPVFKAVFGGLAIMFRAVAAGFTEMGKWISQGLVKLMQALGAVLHWIPGLGGVAEGFDKWEKSWEAGQKSFQDGADAYIQGLKTNTTAMKDAITGLPAPGPPEPYSQGKPQKVPMVATPKGLLGIPGVGATIPKDVSGNIIKGLEGVPGIPSPAAKKAIDDQRKKLKDQVAEATLAVGAASRDLQSAKNAAQDAADSVLSAYDAIAQGQREQVSAQRDLTQARIDAAKHIRELRVEVQGLAADEQDARLKLAYAQEKLKSIEYTNAIDPLVRRSIANEVTQAQSDLNTTLANGQEKRKELNDAEKAGVEGAPDVIKAKERIVQLEADQAEKVRALRKAQRDQRTAVDELTTAQGNYNKAVQTAAQFQREYQKALKDTKPKVSTVVEVTPIIGKPKASTAPKPSKQQLLRLGFDLPNSNIAPAPVNLNPFTQGQAAGGPIHGPGTSTSDSVLRRLSDGEWVHKAAAVNYYGQRNMAAINQMAIPRAVLEQYGHDTPRPVNKKQMAFQGGGYVWPLPGHHAVSSGYGVNRGSYFHGGVDLPAPLGTPIVAAAAGRAIQVGWYGSHATPHSGGGNTVSLAHAGSLVTRSMHMVRTIARLGEVVKAGQVIGLVDSTGDSTGNHLHFQTEIGGRKVNPFSVLGGAPDKGGIPGLAAIMAGLGPAAAPPPLALSAVGETIVGSIIAGQTALANSVKYINTLGAKVPVPPVANAMEIPMSFYDGGGVLPARSATLAVNRTARPERIRNAAQEAELEGGRTIRLDARDIRLLASMLSIANASRPIQMDGVAVGKQVSDQMYLPRGLT
jgi:murein DD-endopeptidase MepM/ murein hydrolase activator NlpD